MHVGGDVSVRAKDIVAIVDIRTAKTSTATKEFLEVMKDEGTLEDMASGDPKSFVVTIDRVFLSPISAGTLGKRTLGVPEKSL